MKENKAEENNNSTDFTVTSPIGEFTIDFKQFEIARKNTDKELNPASVNYARRLMREFLGTDDRLSLIHIRCRRSYACRSRWSRHQ